ncbi:MAG: class I SAM-dependent methyltransferase [bacterium]|nr:class I SAM-dependent methyltransferase [bacterium]
MKNTQVSRSERSSESIVLTARMEDFDSFWEGPADIEKGYTTLFEFYRRNYLPYVPVDRDSDVLVVSCGPGYFVDMLLRHDYTSVQGIDSDPEKIEHARKRDLACQVDTAFEFLQQNVEAFDCIVCEQELNHLTKDEQLVFVDLCRQSLRPGGSLIVHGLNGANPITGPEALAQNFDHYNTFTEYTLNQLLEYSGFERIRVFPLNLYVFYKNPANWLAWGAAAFLNLIFRAAFILYGKSNKIFTKKVAAVCTRPRDDDRE